MLRKKEKAHKPKRRKDKVFLLKLFLLILVFFQITNALAQSPSPTGGGDLSSIEDKIFHQQYPKEKDEDRIGRVEEFLFGVKSNKPYEERLNKVLRSLKTNETPRPKLEAADSASFEDTPSPSHLVSPPTRPAASSKSSQGVLDTISNIEKKVLGKTYDDLSFQARVEQLEEKMLSRSEVINSKSKPLLERVTVLVKRVNVQTGGSSSQNVVPFGEIRPRHGSSTVDLPKAGAGGQSYRIDPNTGEIVNELTGDVVIDASGNPIMVRIPTQLPSNLLPFQNGNYPFLQQQQNRNQNAFPNQLPNQYGVGGQNPLDFLYNQDNLDPGGQNY